MLATQMAAVHLATMTLARRLAEVGGAPDSAAERDSLSSAFNKCARTFASQLEALKRYRSGGEQKVTMQHVSVNEGGQAIVGDVSQTARAPKAAANSPPALGHARRPAMTMIGEQQPAPAEARRGKKDGRRSSAQHRPHAVEPTLRRQDAVGRAVPGAGGAREETLPDAWRRAGNGRTPRQQKRADAWAIYARSDRGAPAAASLAAAIARADATNRVIGRSPEIVARRARGALNPRIPTWAVVSSKAGSRRAGAEPGIMRSLSGRSKRVDAALGPMADGAGPPPPPPAGGRKRSGGKPSLGRKPSAARWRRRLAFFAANAAGRGPPNVRAYIHAFLSKRGAQPSASKPDMFGDRRWAIFFFCCWFYFQFAAFGGCRHRRAAYWPRHFCAARRSWILAAISKARRLPSRR